MTNVGSGSDFQGRVPTEVDRLQSRGVLRLLEMLFVAKSEDGMTQRLTVGDYDDFGGLLATGDQHPARRQADNRTGQEGRRRNRY